MHTPLFQRHVRSLALALVPITLLFPMEPASADVRVVTAQGEYRMGDRDTREEAIRMATEAAKRNALEQVATYLESITVVEGLDVTRDEIRAYTAGLVLVLDQEIKTQLDGDAVVITVELTAQVDTEEVAQAIATLRENEDARHRLAALKEENEQLQRDLESANQALATAHSSEQVQQLAQHRQELLNRVQSNAMVSQAWTDWVLVAPVVYPNPWAGLAQLQALLNVARGLYPASPHVVVAQQVMTTNQPPAPPQPPTPPVPGTSHPTMPSYQIVPQAGARQAPPTLNEISHTTPTAPPQIGNQPPGSRAPTDVRQPAPLLAAPPATGTPPPRSPSRSSARVRQFLQQPPPPGQPPSSGLHPSATGAPERHPGGAPPVARRLPPTLNQIHPPMPHQVPRVPYKMAPRAGGGKGGGKR